MADRERDLWLRAWESYLNSLTSSQRKKVHAIDSLEALRGRVEYLQKKHRSSRTSRCLERMEPLLCSLADFNICVQSFLQAAPREFILLWGSMSLIVEVN